MNKPIYVETEINSDMESLWKATQNPAKHEQWDLRFSSITYLPKKEGEPQHFSYKTKLGFGLQIEGWGKSAGSHNAEDGSRTSSLHFGTENKLSIIKEGRGYWKYIPNGSITFLTQYNYDTNYGLLGKWLDHFLFRPLIGWATALSFDVLKRWLEKGEPPAAQYIRFFGSTLIAWLFALIWIYHGLVPKLLLMHPDEVIPVMRMLPLSFSGAERLVMLIGVSEIAFGLLWLLYRDRRKLFMLQLILFPLLTLSVAASELGVLGQPFNPLTFNLSLFVLSLIGRMLSVDVPTARSCKRKR